MSTVQCIYTSLSLVYGCVYSLVYIYYTTPNLLHNVCTVSYKYTSIAQSTSVSTVSIYTSLPLFYCCLQRSIHTHHFSLLVCLPKVQSKRAYSRKDMISCTFRPVFQEKHEKYQESDYWHTSDYFRHGPGPWRDHQNVIIKQDRNNYQITSNFFV